LKLGAGDFGVGDDQLQTPQRPWRHLSLRGEVADDYRAARATRSQLYDMHVLVLGVMVEIETDLISIEGDSPVDVADRE
jgi:hypothetical protein